MHKEKKLDPIDLDFVIEGSALSFAKFIKRNILGIQEIIKKKLYLSVLVPVEVLLYLLLLVVRL